MLAVSVFAAETKVANKVATVIIVFAMETVVENVRATVLATLAVMGLAAEAIASAAIEKIELQKEPPPLTC